jgi:hypothetical protein
MTSREVEADFSHNSTELMLDAEQYKAYKNYNPDDIISMN